MKDFHKIFSNQIYRIIYRNLWLENFIWLWSKNRSDRCTGMGAPVGSVLVGRKKMMETVKQYRKLIGGQIIVVVDTVVVCRMRLFIELKMYRRMETSWSCSRLWNLVYWQYLAKVSNFLRTFPEISRKVLRKICFIKKFQDERRPQERSQVMGRWAFLEISMNFPRNFWLCTELTAIGLEADKPDTNLLFVNSEKLGHSFEEILNAAQAFQTQPPVLMEVTTSM